MKILLLLIIRLYWAGFPKSKRRKCIFRITCSQYVYERTKQEGLYKGLLALRYRFLNCRSSFQLFENPVDGSKMILLPNAQILSENEISERFRNDIKSYNNGDLIIKEGMLNLIHSPGDR